MTAADRDREALQAVLRWAEQRCPLGVDEHGEEDPGPCPLCGASIANLEPCKSAENTMPSDLLAKVRLALSSPSLTHARAQAGEPVAYLIANPTGEKFLSFTDMDDHEREIGCVSRPLVHPAPAQEPVAVPAGDDDYRSAFEKVAASDGLDVASWDDDEGMYDDSDTQWCWQGWQECLKLLRYLAAAPVSPPAESGDDGLPPLPLGGRVIGAITPAPQPGGEVKVKARPLDLATMLKHAWIAGKTGTKWEDYDPTELVIYQRLAETLDIPLPTPPAGEG